MTDTDILFMSSQAKRITELENENRELKSKKEKMVELLITAAEDFRIQLGIGTCCKCEHFDRNTCSCKASDKCDSQRRWRYESEALKLIGGADNA